jgi:hypothetical protein
MPFEWDETPDERTRRINGSKALERSQEAGRRRRARGGPIPGRKPRPPKAPPGGSGDPRSPRYRGRG